MEEEAVEIELHRGFKGLGFNIRGGLDAPHLDGDSGIFVVKIREEGAAAEDGRLQQGDKLLELNGFDLRNVTHGVAVDQFLSAGDVVKLKVIPGAERAILEKRSAQSVPVGAPSRLSTGTAILAGAAVVSIVAFITYRYMKDRHS